MTEKEQALVHFFERLQSAVDADGRSYRAISKAAGRGPNFVQQLVHDRKEPKVGNVMAVLDALGAKSTLHVMLGIEFNEQDEEFFNVLLASPPHVRSQVLELFRSMRAVEPS